MTEANCMCNCGMTELHDIRQPPKTILLDVGGYILDRDFADYGPKKRWYFVDGKGWGYHETSSPERMPLKDRNGFAYVIFTDNQSLMYGRRLANYLRRQKLGKVITTPTRINTNSGHRIQAWTWVVDRRALTKWMIKNDKTYSKTYAC